MGRPTLPGVAVITGAASGIGRTIAVACIQQGCIGVGLLDRDERGLAETVRIINEVAKTSRVVSIVVNISNPDEITKAYEEIYTTFSRVDYSIHAAGIVVHNAPSTELSLEDFDRQYNVNCRGLWLCSREAIKIMQKQTVDSEAYPDAGIPSSRGQRGAIINVSASLALHTQRGMPAYTAAKSAVLGLTRADAVDFAKDKIRVNAVLPGMVDTPATNTSPEMRAWLEANPLQRTPLKRVAAPEEIADVICFLASHGASYVTGASWEIDGGFLAGV